MSGTTTHREGSTFSSARYLASLMAELDRAAISTRIREARKQAGFRNRNDIADLLHVHPRTIEDWENAKHQNVPWDRLDEIARVTGVSREWLLHGEPEEAEDELMAIRSQLQAIEDDARETQDLIARGFAALGVTLALRDTEQRDEGAQAASDSA